MTNGTAVKEMVVGGSFEFNDIPLKTKTVVFRFHSSDDPASELDLVRVEEKTAMVVIKDGNTWRESTGYCANILSTRILTVMAVGIELLPKEGGAEKKLPPFHKYAIAIFEHRRDKSPSDFLSFLTMQYAAAEALTQIYVPPEAMSRVVEALLVMAKNCDQRSEHTFIAARAIIMLDGVDQVDQYCDQFDRDDWRGRLWEAISKQLAEQSTPEPKEAVTA